MAPGTTISASIANEFTEAVGALYTSSLVALGALLFIITFTVIAAARYMLLRLDRRALVQRMTRRRQVRKSSATPQRYVCRCWRPSWDLRVWARYSGRSSLVA